MRVAARGNLTVELIRQHRFSPDPSAHRHPQAIQHFSQHETYVGDAWRCRTDKVELSPEALGCEGRHVNACQQPAAWPDRASESVAIDFPPQAQHEPKPITPVAGSPALAGLGTALIVPGTLLDVLA